MVKNPFEDIKLEIDICNFGLVKFEISIDEEFGRNVDAICVTVVSSDDEARTDPEIIHNVEPGKIYELSLLADLTDLTGIGIFFRIVFSKFR